MPTLDRSRAGVDLGERRRVEAPRTLVAALRRAALRPLAALIMAMVAFGLTQVLLHVTGTRALVSLPGDAPMVVAVLAGVHHGFRP